MGENVIDKDYTQLYKSNETNYTQTNAESIQKIIRAINENLAEMRLIRNQLNTENNVYTEGLFKKDQLLRMENEELQNQLRELEAIQSTIMNKDAVIGQLHANTDEYGREIILLVICLGLAVLLFIKTCVYAQGMVSFRVFITLFIYVMICYVLLFMYFFNILYLQDSVNYFLSSRQRKIDKKMQNWTAINDPKKGTNQDQWIEENCNCPTSTQEEGESSEEIYAEDDGDFIRKELPGTFYYDGSSPPELIAPFPPGEEYIRMNEQIDWVDYSNDGNSKYTPLTNKTRYENSQFYNYASIKDPLVRKMHREERGRASSITTNL